MQHKSTSPDTAVQAGTALPVMEHFYTLQGEGAFAGQAAYFIRLGGCDVGCHWCDVKESWQLEGHPVLTVEELVAQASAHPARMAVVTGGEPLMHPLGPLTTALKEVGFRVHMETSGSRPMSGSFDWVTLSPKKFKAPLAEAYAAADELKVIVYNKHDLVFAEREAAKVSPRCLLFLQPEWSRADEVLPWAIEHVKAHPRWRVSLQTHKYLQIP